MPISDAYGGTSTRWPKPTASTTTAPIPAPTPVPTQPVPAWPSANPTPTPIPTTPIPAPVPAYTPTPYVPSGDKNSGTPNPVLTETQKAWDEFLKADPFYTQTTGVSSAQSQTDAAERDRQIQQALIMFGEVPSGLTGPWLNDTVTAAAQDATNAGLSTTARLQKAASDTRRDTLKALAARGILRSGETGYQLDEGSLRANQAQYDARQSLLDFIHGRNYNFNTAELGRQLAQIQAQFEAAQRGSMSGIGPLVPGFGQDVPQFKLNPIRGAGQGYYAPSGGDPYGSPAPAGQQWVQTSNGAQLQPITPAAFDPNAPFMGYPNYAAWLAAWGGGGSGSVM